MQQVDWEFKIPIATEEELRHFVLKAWGVTIPDVRVCPEHSTPWEAFCDAYFARSEIAVWKASRGLGGKSYLLAVLALTEAVTLKCDVNVLGGSGEQSGNVLRYTNDLWTLGALPADLLLTEVKRETRLLWGNHVRALKASSTSVRGPHIPRLRLDEIDEMTLEIFDAAMGQTLADTERGEDGKLQIKVAAQTVCSSTHHYSDATMTEVLRRAEERNYPVFLWCYKESAAQPGGWLLQSEIDRKKREVTHAMWVVEFELQEPSPEDRAIMPDRVEFMFASVLGEYKGMMGEVITITPPMYQCENCEDKPWFPVGELADQEACTCPDCGSLTSPAVYATGADWAKTTDYTVIVTLRLDVEPVALVAYERMGREPWPVMIQRLDDRLALYPGTGAHDRTGLGAVVDDYLVEDAEGVMMVGRRRDELLNEYIIAVEDQLLQFPKILTLYNDHKFVSRNDLWGAGHPPDGFVASAMAWYARPGVMFI